MGRDTGKGVCEGRLRIFTHVYPWLHQETEREGGVYDMAQAGKGRLNYRCPSCFMRDLDLDMFYDRDKKEYYCIRCQYKGAEEDVLEKNEMARFRYGGMNKRYTKFDFD